MTDPVRDFDTGALYDALDEQRRERGLTWQQVTREINDLFRNVPCRPVSTSTLTGMRTRSALGGNGVLQMLVWLDRTPESLVPGHPEPDAPEARLPRVGPDRILRWDTQAIFASLDAQRIERGLTWREVAAQIGGTAASLTTLPERESVAFPYVMRMTRWLQRPAAAFTRSYDA